MSELEKKNLYSSISSLIAEARKSVRSTVNSAMVITYWNIGRLIVEDEQKGERRAKYGKGVLKELSMKLTAEFGKGFDIRNIRHMRQFFLAFPIRYTLRTELETQPDTGSIGDAVRHQFNAVEPVIRNAVGSELQKEPDNKSICDALRHKLDSMSLISPDRKSECPELQERHEEKSIGHAVSDQLKSRNGARLLIVSPPVSLALSWTHYRHLIRVENEKARLWYMNETVSENWSTRALERQINSHYYERLLASQNKEPVRKEAEYKTSKLTPQDVLKDPYVLEFLQLKNRSEYTESQLETALLDDLQSFLLELGSGFSFVARQKHFEVDGEHFYIDLVFYNFKLKCFVLIDLKRGKLTHQDVGQMDMYVRLFEEKMRGEDDNPTIGLVLCSDKSEAVAKYSVLAENERLFASKYKLILPSEEELARQIAAEIDELHEVSAIYRISSKL